MFVALVRPVSDSFPSAILADGLTSADISLPLVRAQHAAYVAALERLGATVVPLPALPSLPDAVFVEDAAVRVGGAFVIPGSAPSASSRAGEASETASALRALGYTCTPVDFALDGGDVLRAGGQVFVGVSERTDARAVESMRKRFAEVGTEVTPVPVAHCLHLKTAVTWVSTGGGEGFLVAAESDDGRAVVGGFPEGWKVCWLPEDEAYACNVLQVREGGDVLMLAGFPEAIRRVEGMLKEISGESAASVEVLEMSEFRKANGSLTCPSIIFEER